jgi:hypothetical protein
VTEFSVSQIETGIVLEPSLPLGAKIIGEVDPRGLTAEEFKNSPDLLFHGSKSHFNLNPNLDYSGEQYFVENDGSLTLGTGFYTTSDRSAAEDYSLIRQKGEAVRQKKETEPVILELLPHKAAMLDLRNEKSSDQNIPIPRTLFEKWRERFVRYYKEADRTKQHPFEGEYLRYLDEIAEFPDIDLRTMLQTGTDIRLRSNYYTAPPWGQLFADFMKSEGYDGVIYFERGEGENKKISASYAFYNLEKIGTFEDWQKRKEGPEKKFARETGGILIELPMASKETGIRYAVIYPENFKPDYKRLYRGSRTALPETLDSQASSMLRDTSSLKENDPYARKVNILPIIESLREDVGDLAKNPTLEKHEEIVAKAPPQPKEEMEVYLRIIKGYMRDGLSYQQALYKTHLNAYEGTYGATPYLSLYENPIDALKCAASTLDGSLLLINVSSEDYIDPETQFKHEGEVYAYGTLPRDRIYAVIITNNMLDPENNPKTKEDIQKAIEFVNNIVAGSPSPTLK